MTMYRIQSGGLHGRYEGNATDSEGRLLQRELIVYGPATMADGRPRPTHDTDGNLNPGFVEREDGSVIARDVIDLSGAEAKSPSFKGRIQKLEVQPEKTETEKAEKPAEKVPEKPPQPAPGAKPAQSVTQQQKGA